MSEIQFGPRFNHDGSVTFQLWAEGCESIGLQLLDESSSETLPMQPMPGGFFSLRTAATAATRYWFCLPNGQCRPDPASRFQPAGVHGPSQLIDPHAYTWSDSGFRGISKDRMVLYELHIGTFSPAGTYQGAIERLPELVEMGINTIELMPVAQSAGQRNWGYDGVNLFAPRNTYGTPDQLRQLVDAAHQHGIGVIMDVVYNHFGAEGNYLHEFGSYVSKHHTTPWGDAPNFDEPGAATMRKFIVANALYWIEDFHLDGLRLDAVHCMADDSETHVVHDIAQAFAELRGRTERTLHLIAESNVYDPELLRPLDRDGHGFDSIWCDDFLHSVTAIIRPNDQMSNRQYLPHLDLDMTLRRGFVFHGQLGSDRRRVPLDEPTAEVPLESLIFSIQNHDFIGNHPHGKRLHQLTSLEAQQAAAALLLLYPSIPMLFMGEEFASENPFYFFTDFGDEHLRKAVEIGRQLEYPQHDWTGVDSPLSEAAFEQSKLSGHSPGSEVMRSWYKRLIALRTSWQASDLLHAGNLRAWWSQADSLATVLYESASENQSAFALVRLHPPEESPAPLSFDVQGDVALSNACRRTDSHTHRWELAENSVLVGLGTATQVQSAAQPSNASNFGKA